jgi:hypothetical protein
MMINRRKFQEGMLAVISSICATNANAELVDENSKAALGLGFKLDSSSVDGSKFPKYANWQACENCALFASAGAGVGKCPLFAGREVSASGWCSAYAKRHGYVPVHQNSTAVTTPRTQNLPQPASVSTMSLENAKEKCKSIGFTPGTEKFGGCVLQLTR